jgi:hypothetical protein
MHGVRPATVGANWGGDGTMAEREGRSLRLEEGETLEFPVSEEHPLADVQRFVDVGSLEDVQDFEVVREFLRATDPREAPAVERSLLRAFHPSSAMLVQLMRDLGPILQLRLDDFVVPAGSRVVMNSALNQILANDVVISGVLEVRGDLTVTCNEIRG